MEESTIIMDPGAIARGQCASALETILREGGRRLLQEALELEVRQYIERFQPLKSESGQGLVVRNGYHQERELVTGAGKVPVRPTARTTTAGQRSTSPVPSYPPYLRRTPSIDALIPALYLKGVSTSSPSRKRCRRSWVTVWPVYRRTTSCGSSKSGSRSSRPGRSATCTASATSTCGADAVYFNVRLQKDRPCVLVVAGATEDGHKELLAIQEQRSEKAISAGCTCCRT